MLFRSLTYPLGSRTPGQPHPDALQELLQARLGHWNRWRHLHPARVPRPPPFSSHVPDLTSLHSEKVYLAPSGVQKERIEPRDIFVLTLSSRAFLRWPVHKPLKQSACTPLFYNAYELRQAGACIHTHSQHAVMVTLLWKGNEFRLSHQEMIKGMRIGGTGTALSYLDTLVIPIIENTPDEEDLREGMEAVSWAVERDIPSGS